MNFLIGHVFQGKEREKKRKERKRHRNRTAY